jgi:hypothetical protein
MKEELLQQSLEYLILLAGVNLREITFHSDGRIIAKTGGKAPFPKRLYPGKTAKEAVVKLILENNPRGANSGGKIYI